MAVLALLADPRFLGWNIALSKILAAEVAMLNNFVWNQLWTFRPSNHPGANTRAPASPPRGILRHLVMFNAICAVGIALAVVLLHLFHSWFGWNLYLSNMLAIVITTFWNFSLNARYTWGQGQYE